MNGLMYREQKIWLPNRRVPKLLLENPKLLIIDERYMTAGRNNSHPLQDMRSPAWLVVPPFVNGVLQELPPHTCGLYGVIRVHLGTLKLFLLQPCDSIETHLSAAALGSFSIPAIFPVASSFELTEEAFDAGPLLQSGVWLPPQLGRQGLMIFVGGDFWRGRILGIEYLIAPAGGALAPPDLRYGIPVEVLPGPPLQLRLLRALKPHELATVPGNAADLARGDGR